jgi:hypothetical protein
MGGGIMPDPTDINYIKMTLEAEEPLDLKLSRTEAYHVLSKVPSKMTDKERYAYELILSTYWEGLIEDLKMSEEMEDADEDWGEYLDEDTFRELSPHFTNVEVEEEKWNANDRD